jgi:hypothetical protein
MRKELTRPRLLSLMNELAKTAPRRGPNNVYLVGGGTAVYLVNIDFARPEDFVPPLQGSEARHVFIDKIGSVTFLHYDPYAQLLSKIIRGFQRDLDDARKFVSSGMVDPRRLAALVKAIPDSTYARYPSLSPAALRRAVADFIAEIV